jgi:hypothetical protein
MAQWLAGRFGISSWTGRRWVNASHVIAKLPHISEALQSGRLGLDKVVELCRFATPESEQRLIAWARRVTLATIRKRADVAGRPELEEVRSTAVPLPALVVERGRRQPGPRRTAPRRRGRRLGHGDRAGRRAGARDGHRGAALRS